MSSGDIAVDSCEWSGGALLIRLGKQSQKQERARIPAREIMSQECAFDLKAIASISHSVFELDESSNIL